MRRKNITVALEEDVARWARVKAAQQDTSVSALLAQMLRESMVREDEYARAMKDSMARKPFLNSDGKYLSREDLYQQARGRGAR